MVGASSEGEKAGGQKSTPPKYIGKGGPRSVQYTIRKLDEKSYTCKIITKNQQLAIFIAS
jgi:hypothetical protein